MNRPYLLLTVSFVLLLVAAHTGVAEVSLPDGQALEAEANVAADSKVIDDADASGGKAVTNEKAWQPLFTATVPTEGDAFTVWLRHRDGPFILKAMIDGAQKDLKQLWGSPEKWAWTNCGRYTRAELGEKFLIIRGAGNKTPAIDVVVLATDENAKPEGFTGNPASAARPLPASQPSSLVPAQRVEVKVAWDQTVGRVPATIWGVNDYEILNPTAASDPKLQAYLGQCHVPIVRIHQGTLPNPWLNQETKSWDVEKIKAGFAASTGYGDARVMLNLATWPKWMLEPGKGDFLAKDQSEAYVQLIAELVRVMRDDVHRKIDYWEITNEKEGAYQKAGRLDELWDIFNQTADAIKKVDPTTKVGGPALTWPKKEWVDSFLSKAAGHFDFITWHSYGTGDIYDSNETLMSKIDEIEKNSRNVTDAIKQLGGGKKIDQFLSEYNVKWTWNPLERRHANSIGAVFQACVVRRMALLGIDGAMVWHVKGNAYGLLDAKGDERPTAYLYSWGPKYLTGDLVSASVSDEKVLELLPVRRADGSRAMLLSNKSDHALILPSGTQLLGMEGPIDLLRVDADGLSTPTLDVSDALSLPGYSNTLITQKP